MPKKGTVTQINYGDYPNIRIRLGWADWWYLGNKIAQFFNDTYSPERTGSFAKHMEKLAKDKAIELSSLNKLWENHLYRENAMSFEYHTEGGLTIALNPGRGDFKEILNTVIDNEWLEELEEELDEFIRKEAQRVAFALEMFEICREIYKEKGNGQ